MNSKNSLCESKVPKNYIEIQPLNLHNWELNIPSSKSYSNRLLILGAMNGKGFSISNLSLSSDVTNLLAVFKKIGIEFELNIHELVFKNSFLEADSKNNNEVNLVTGDGGTTNRFLIALLSKGKRKYHIYPSEKLSERPIDDLLNPLEYLGVKIEVNKNYDFENKTTSWVTIQGPALLNKKEPLEIDCHYSTQFASALKLVFHKDKLHFNLKNVENSKKYLELTDNLIERVSSGDVHFEVPIDFSSASYPIALAVLRGNLVIRNTHAVDTYQADAEFINLLKNLGAEVEFLDMGLVVKKSTSLRPFSFDVATAPDLFPTLVFLASFINGSSRCFNLEILKYKESNRLVEMIKLLDLFEIDYLLSENENELIINGPLKKFRSKVSYCPPRDHRIVMIAALFMSLNNGGTLYQFDCVNKSYPKFFELLGEHIF